MPTAVFCPQTEEAAKSKASRLIFIVDLPPSFIIQLSVCWPPDQFTIKLFADAAVPDQLIKLEFFRRHAINLLVPGLTAFAIQFPYFGVAAEGLRIVLRVSDES